jgi:hypothetical protein
MKKIFLSILLTMGFYTVQAQADSLKQYTGKYKFPEGSPTTEVTVTIENGLLMANSSIGTTELKPSGTADVFEVVAYGGTATFKRKDGKVSGVQIQVNDLNMEGEKTEGLAFTGEIRIKKNCWVIESR